MKAPSDVFTKPNLAAEEDSEWQDGSSDEDSEQVPRRFNSRREERIYLGRGYNRLGLKKQTAQQDQTNQSAQAQSN